MKKNLTRWIASAAIRISTMNDRTYFAVGGKYHDHIMDTQIDGFCELDYSMEDVYALRQGFLDNMGQFMTQEEAWPIAKAAGQIINRIPDDNGEKLYPENLYKEHSETKLGETK